MSSTLAPSTLSPNNPITPSSVPDALAKLGLTCPPKDLESYTSLLTGIWEIWNKVDGMDDYVPSVDEERFPRTEIARVEGGEEGNEHNAWAWKCRIEDAKGGKGLLAGKTVCLKDNVAVKGVPCLLGTDIFDDWIPNTDATIVTRILKQGGIINGKSVCENLSLWGVSCSAATGPIDNPHAAGFSAGGSSSGTAVLVSRGFSDLGIGGDQGGSIRLPSAMSGIVGMKPTTGLVPYTGIASLEPVIDHAGPMTRVGSLPLRPLHLHISTSCYVPLLPLPSDTACVTPANLQTVLDNALLLQAIAGADGIDDRQLAGCPFPSDVPDYPKLAQGGVKGLRIGIMTEGFDTPMSDPRVSALVRKAAEEWRSLGAEVGEVSVEMHKIAPELWAVGGRLSASTSLLGQNCGRRQLCMNELTAKMLPLTQDKFDKMFASGANTLINGVWGWENLPPTLMGKATNLIRKLRDAYYTALDSYDLLIMPTVPFLAPKLLPDVRNASVVDLMVNSAGVSLNTSAFNITGLPALSLPVGFLPHPLDTSANLPVGMQIVGKFYSEATIYRAAYAWEQAFDWKTYADKA